MSENANSGPSADFEVSTEELCKQAWSELNHFSGFMAGLSASPGLNIPRSMVLPDFLLATRKCLVRLQKLAGEDAR